MTATISPNAPFIAHLSALTHQGNRSALMAMRSSLGHRDGIGESAVIHVGGFADPSDAARERSYYLLAGLFALWHTANTAPPGTGKPLGAALGVVFRTDARLSTILLEELTRARQDHVRSAAHRAVAVLSRERIALNWLSLADDLTCAPHLWTRRQRRWAYDFYADKRSVWASSDSTEAQS